MSYRTLGSPSTERPMQAISNEASPLTATRKGVIQKMGTKIDIILSESAKAKKQCHSPPYSVIEYGMTNESISSVALPLTATPKWVKRG